ncbi:MAG: hypothetical protein KTR31_11950 [Myxococcales bacterium]|nr:hypothetical protein [Myxococcales bacterium]
MSMLVWWTLMAHAEPLSDLPPQASVEVGDVTWTIRVGARTMVVPTPTSQAERDSLRALISSLVTDLGLAPAPVPRAPADPLAQRLLQDLPAPAPPTPRPAPPAVVEAPGPVRPEPAEAEPAPAPPVVEAPVDVRPVERPPSVRVLQWPAPLSVAVELGAVGRSGLSVVPTAGLQVFAGRTLGGALTARLVPVGALSRHPGAGRRGGEIDASVILRPARWHAALAGGVALRRWHDGTEEVARHTVPFVALAVGTTVRAGPLDLVPEASVALDLAPTRIVAPTEDWRLSPLSARLRWIVRLRSEPLRRSATSQRGPRETP